MKRRIIIIAFGLAVLGGLGWVIMPHEPVYKGKPLSYWLASFNSRGAQTPTEFGQAVAAMNHIGTNAIPTLLRILRAQDPPWKLKLVALAQKQKVFKINFVPATSRYEGAVWGFLSLREKASNAVPVLVEIYDREMGVESRQAVMRSLYFTGPALKTALSTMLRATTDTNWQVRLYAATVLAQLGTNGTEAVPALLGQLRDTNQVIRMTAAEALKRIDPEAAKKAGIQ